MSEELSGALRRDAVTEPEIKLRDLSLPSEWLESLANEVFAQLGSVPANSNANNPPEGAVRKLCLALISESENAGSDIVQTVRAEGASREDVCLLYLATAAQMLGDWWTENRVSFAQVTIGTSRIYAILRDLRCDFEPPTQKAPRSAVFASVPGETHTLGVSIAADLFRDDGWDICLRVGLAQAELIDQIESLDCRLIGLSISGKHSMPALAEIIGPLRKRLPATPILVAGHSVEELGSSINPMGVDGVASTIDEAREIARSLVVV